MNQLNELYSMHQRALLRAAEADQDQSRQRHEAKADRIATKISSIQDANGVNAVQLLPAASI